jgi:hypothetical protein
VPFCYKENGVVKLQRLIGVIMEFGEKTKGIATFHKD